MKPSTLSRVPALLLLLALAALAPQPGAEPGADPGRERPPALPTAYREAALRGDWGAAARAARELAAADPARADLGLYLEARALRRAARAPEALERVQELLGARHAGSAWRTAAVHLRTELLTELGRLEGAREGWEGQAALLRAPARKGRLAEGLIELAASLTREPDPADPRAAAPQHQRAAVLLERALALDPPRELEDRARFDLARARVGLGRPREALAALRDYLARFDPSAPGAAAARLGAGRQVFAARLELGRQLLASSDAIGARRAFEDLVAAARAARAGDGVWAAAPLGAEARAELEALSGEASFAIAGTFVPRGEEGLLAIGALRRFLAAFPAHRRAGEAEAGIAALLEGTGRLGEALEAYVRLSAAPPPAEAAGEAREAHARRVREAHFARARLLARLERFAEAREAYAHYAARFPSGERWSEAQRGVLDAQLGLGELLRREGRHPQARQAMQRFLEEQPLDPRAPRLALEIGESFAEEAEALATRTPAAPAEHIETLRRSALAQWEALVAKHPGSDEASRALLRRGELLETRLLELEAALEAYRAVTFGPWQAAARARLAALTEESLAVRTERTYRSDEPARVTLQTRNLERVRVDLFALDLESYFARHRTHLGIERLDLDLIAPDRSTEVELADYAPYAPLERELDLELEGVGVWAVAVTAGERRATTLILRSDLELIQKASRREVFVYVQDMAHGAPAAGARVLVSHAGPAGPALATLETDAQGVARLTFDPPRDGGEVRVLALRAGHVAADGLDLAGLALGTEPTPRGWVYTDRPVYRPGDPVRWRALLRAVRAGALVVDEGSVLRVELLDPTGAALFREEQRLSDFGSLHGEFTLPARVASGNFAIRVEGADGSAHVGGFRVEPYRPQPIELTLEPERGVVERGEAVRLVARARYVHGEPLVGAGLLADLPDGRRLELETDAAGAASLEFETRDFVGEGLLAFGVLLPTENLLARAAVHLAREEFSLAFDPGREVVLAGETFGLSLRAVAADGTPLAKALTLSVLRRVSDPGGTWSEIPVEERELATDPARGEARATLSLARGGSYVLRASAVDRFQNPIQAERALRVAGEGDGERLRWIVADARVGVGAALEAVLADRDGGGLALVTFETERVLGHRLVELRRGRNAVAFEVLDAHAPALVLAAALLDGRRLHTARAELEVRRELRVELELVGAGHAPGERARVRLAAFDAAGRPARAELSLAVVDDAVLARYPGDGPALPGRIGLGGPRAAGLLTTSSAAFRYEGVTARIAGEILAEAERRQAEEQWEARREDILRDLEAPNERGAALKVELARELAESEVLDDAFFLGSGAQRRARAGGGRTYTGPGDTAPPAAGRPAPLESEPDPDTAFWVADLATDGEGRAEVEFTLPPRSTRWRLVAVAADRGAAFGEARGELVARAELFAELRAPEVLFEGDAPRIGARLGAAGLVGEATLTLVARRGTLTRSLPGRVALGGEASVEHLFAALDPGLVAAAGAGPSDPDGDELELELIVEARVGGRTLGARARRTVALLPYGIELGDAASGPLGERVVRELSLPEGRYSSRRLALRVGSGLEALLLDEALGRGPGIRRGCLWLPPDPAADLIGVATLLRHWPARAGVGLEDRRLLEERARALLAELVGMQEASGAFRPGGPADPEPEAHAARALWAFALAREVGLAPPPAPLERAISFARNALREAAQRSTDLEAALVHALALHGQGDFARLNRLHRLRASLSTPALAHAALALAAMDNLPLASELGALLEERARPEPGPGPRRAAWEADAGRAPYPRLSETALAILALEGVRPGSEVLDAGVEALLAARPWYDSRARGLAVAAVAQRRARAVTDEGPLRVELAVAGFEPLELALGPDAPRGTLELELGPGPGGKLSVTLSTRGRGTPHYALVLGGIAVDSAPRPAAAFELLEQRLEAPRPTFQGRELVPGFSVLERFEAPWTNEVRQLELGARASFSVAWQRRLGPGASSERRPALLLDLPLPAGARVLPGGVRGASAHLGSEGRVVFRLEPGAAAGRVEVDLVGLVPGTYRVPPPVLYDADLPRERAVGAARALSVLPRGERSRDPYRPTPDELLQRGLALFELGRAAEAAEPLTRLFDEHGSRLRDEPLRRAAWALLRAALEADDAARLVRAFELVVERDPERALAAADVERAARAYGSLGEHARALHLYRALVEESFGADFAVARTLGEVDATAEALTLTERLLEEYPELGVTQRARLDLAGRLLGAAPGAARDASLRRAGLDRAELTLRGILHLERFLAFDPLHPLAPDAGLDLVQALLELRDHRRAAHLASLLAAAYVQPLHQDAFRYAGALAHWELGELEPARALFGAVAEARYSDASGRTFPSPNRPFARYLLAQIAHATGDAPEALRRYAEVEREFPDARAALEELRREELELAEVTSGAPGAPLELELRYRNAPRVELLVYAVDLLTLYLREKDLSQVAQVELAGIEPTLRRTLDLEAGPHLRARTRAVPLTLPRPGAYLVIARGAERFASGLVLSSDLELEVREDPVAGTLRVQAFERSARIEPRFATGVDVRVVGSGDGAIRSGRTDRRGLFSAVGITGRPTVVARLGEHYAFHRGAEPLTPAAPAADRAQAPAAPQFLEHLRGLHRASQESRRKTLEEDLRSRGEGLRAGSAAP